MVRIVNEDINISDFKGYVGKELKGFLGDLDPKARILVDRNDKSFNGMVQQVTWDYADTVIDNIQYDSKYNAYIVSVR